jgi:hypothetical protein
LTTREKQSFPANVRITVVAPNIDESKWPFVVVTMPSEALSNDELERHMDTLSLFWKRGQPFVLIVDVRFAPPLEAPQRRIVAERLDLLTDKAPGVLRGNAVVLNNTVQRGIVKVLTWLTKRSYSMEPFGSLEDALAWAARVVLRPEATPKQPA